MKQALSICAIALIFCSGWSSDRKKKQQSKKVEHSVNAKSYKVVSDHRAPGMSAKAKRGKKEQRKKAHEKVQKTSKSREHYYKKHKSRGVQVSMKKKK